jgi:nitrite reductase (NO-forming)
VVGDEGESPVRGSPPAPARLWALILAVAGRARQTPQNLSLDGGPKTPDLKPGQKATLDAGTITKAMTGACSIPGHKEAGMTFEVHLSGMAPAATAEHADASVDDSAKLDPTPPRRPPGNPMTPR